MKVMCIKNGLWTVTRIEKPSFGETCFVIDSFMIAGDLCYRIEGYEFKPDGGERWCNADRFIPLSSIDETELVKERLTTVNQ
jgi:hypothetical protein